MNRRFPEIGALNFRAACEHLDFLSLRNTPLSGAIVTADHTFGINLVWEVTENAPRGIHILPHEARALGEALIAAADHVAPYKVKP